MSQSIMRSSSFRPCKPGKYSVRKPTPEEDHRHVHICILSCCKSYVAKIADAD